MTRERWEQVLFAHVPDEVVQDMLNAYVLELEAENAKLRAERDEWYRVAESKQDIIGHMRDANAENAKLRKLVNSYADSFDRYAAMNNGCGPYYSGEDWLALANDMRIELAECCGELGVEVDDA